MLNSKSKRHKDAAAQNQCCILAPKASSFWMLGPKRGNLNGYYNFQALATSNPNFVQSLLNAAMLMMQSQQQTQEQEPPDKPLERF